MEESNYKGKHIKLPYYRVATLPGKTWNLRNFDKNLEF